MITDNSPFLHLFPRISLSALLRLLLEIFEFAPVIPWTERISIHGAIVSLYYVFMLLLISWLAGCTCIVERILPINSRRRWPCEFSRETFATPPARNLAFQPEKIYNRTHLNPHKSSTRQAFQHSPAPIHPI